MCHSLSAALLFKPLSLLTPCSPETFCCSCLNSPCQCPPHRIRDFGRVSPGGQGRQAARARPELATLEPDTRAQICRTHCGWASSHNSLTPHHPTHSLTLRGGGGHFCGHRSQPPPPPHTQGTPTLLVSLWSNQWSFSIKMEK